MTLSRFLVVVLLVVGSCVTIASAQPAVIARAETALADGRVTEALSLVDRALKWDDDPAEIHFLHARVLKAIGETKDAAKAIDRAVDRDPENLSFLELQLELGFPQTALTLMRRVKVSRLAGKILERDSLNATANWQRAAPNVRDWFHYRNLRSVIGFQQLQGGQRMNLPPEQMAAESRDFFNLGTHDRFGRNILDKSESAGPAYDEAVESLKRAIQGDNMFLPAYRTLAALYMTKPDDARLESLSRHMREALPDTPDGYLLGGYVDILAEQFRSAEDWFEKAMVRMPDSLASLYASAERVLRPELQDTWDPRDDIDFWTHLDPRLLTATNERKEEHLRRMVWTNFLYGEPKLNLDGWDSERGQIYIRYGKPDADVNLDNSPVDCGNNSHKDFNVFEYGDMRFVFSNPPPGIYNEWVIYSPCSGAAVVGRDLDYVIKTRERIREEPQRFVYKSPAARVEFPYLVTIFKNDSSLHGDVVIPFGIPVPYKPRRGSLRLPIKTGAFLLADTVGVVDESRGTHTRLAGSGVFEFDDATVWAGLHTLSAGAGTYAVSVEFETSQTAAVVGYHRSEIEIPDYDAEKLQLSDLLPAYFAEEAGGSTDIPAGFLLRRDVLLKPAPWGVFNQQQPLYLYFESYGMTLGPDGRTSYDVEAALLQESDDSGIKRFFSSVFGRSDDTGVSVRFSGEGISADDGQYLILDATGQEPGTYVVVVRVQDILSGEVVDSRRTIILE